MTTLFELTVMYAYKHEGDLKPLADYLRERLPEEEAELIVKVLYGEIKRGDSRKVSHTARKLSMAFDHFQSINDIAGLPRLSKERIYKLMSERYGGDPAEIKSSILRYKRNAKRSAKGVT